MDVITDMLGLAVLSSPLWLIVIMVPVAIVIAVVVAKRCRSASSKLVSALSVLLVFFVAMFGDEVVGRVYLNHLCAMEAGVKVYRTIELPAEYWDENGAPKYYGAGGFVDLRLLPGRFEWISKREEYFDFVVRIEERRTEFVDKETNTVLGEKITFMRHFGWLGRLSPAPNIGVSCRELVGEANRNELRQEEINHEQELFSGILKPASSAK